MDEGTLINIAVTIQDQLHRHKKLVEKLTSARQRKDVYGDVVCFIGICLSVLASVRVRLRP